MKRLGLLLTLVLSAPARAQDAPVPPAPGDSLREADAVRMALDASPAARAARARLWAAQAARALSRSPLVEAPEAEVTTTLGPALVPDADDHTTEAGVSVTLERPGVRRARRAAADAALAAATAEARATLDGLAYEVRTRFAELRAQEAVAALAAVLHADADTLVAAVALRERYGDASELDLRLTRLDAVRAAAEADAAALEAAETRARLAALLGTTPGALSPLAAPEAAVPDTLRAGPPPSAVLAAEAAAREAAAAAQYARVRKRIPTFTLHGGVEYSRLFFGPDDLDAEGHLKDEFRRLGRADVGLTVGVSFPLPFGSPAGRESVLAEAEAAARAAEATQTAAEIAAEAEAARVALARAQARQARYRAAASDVSESLYLLRLAYAGGEIGLEALLAGRGRIYETLAATLRADAEITRARLDLARALGTLLTRDEYVPDTLLDR
jgi:outer membrane protein, heavy metal efflux system